MSYVRLHGISMSRIPAPFNASRSMCFEPIRLIYSRVIASVLSKRSYAET